MCIVNIKKLAIKLIVLCMLFQDVLITNSTGLFNDIISYLDEIIAFYFFVYIIYQVFIKKIELVKLEKKILICWVSIIFIGAISSIHNRIQPFFPSLIDAFTCSKFMLTFSGSSIMWRKLRYTDNIIHELNGIIRFMSILLSILIVINVFIIQIFRVYDFRLFIYSQGLFFGNHSSMALFSIYAIVILIYNSRYHRGNIFYIILYTIIALTTMRYKEIAVILLIWLLYLYFVLGKFKSKLFIAVGVIFVVVMFGWDQFINYYGNTTQRSILTLSSYKIANDFFPLGAGFATFASYMSGTYYSPLYIKYGLSNIWGISRDNLKYITDGFLPAVLGEFGWFGLIVFIAFFYILCKELISMKNKWYFICAASLLAYAIISALGTSSIFNPLLSFLALFLSNIFVMDINIGKRGR